MGILDYINNLKFNPTPVNMGLLQMGAQMLANSGPSTVPQGFGKALGGGLLGFASGYGDVMKQQREADESNMDKELKAAQIEAGKSDAQYKMAQMEALKTGKTAAATPGQWWIPPNSKPEVFGGLEGFRAPDGSFIPSRGAMSEYQRVMTSPSERRRLALATEGAKGTKFTLKGGAETVMPQSEINPDAFNFGAQPMTAQRMDDKQAFFDLYNSTGGDAEKTLAEWSKLKGSANYTTGPIGGQQGKPAQVMPNLPPVIPKRGALVGPTFEEQAAAKALEAGASARAKYEAEANVANMNAGNVAAAEAQKKSAVLSAENKAKAQADLPNVLSASDYSLELLSKLEAHPGLSGVVGMPSFLGLTRAPGTKESDFRVLQEQVLGRQFLEAYQTLKGGGQITEIEGKKATDAMGRLSAAQSEQAFKEAVRELKGIISIARDRAVKRAEGGAFLPNSGAPKNNQKNNGGWGIQRVE